MGKGPEGLFQHELKEEEGHEPTQKPQNCARAKREICGETHGAELVILEETEILCLVVTPGDHAPGITPNTNEPKNTSTKSPRTSMVRRAGEVRQCVSPRRRRARWPSRSTIRSHRTGVRQALGLRETSASFQTGPVPTKQANSTEKQQQHNTQRTKETSSDGAVNISLTKSAPGVAQRRARTTYPGTALPGMAQAVHDAWQHGPADNERDTA